MICESCGENLSAEDEFICERCSYCMYDRPYDDDQSEEQDDES